MCWHDAAGSMLFYSSKKVQFCLVLIMMTSVAALNNTTLCFMLMSLSSAQDKKALSCCAQSTLTMQWQHHSQCTLHTDLSSHATDVLRSVSVRKTELCIYGY